MEEINKEVLLSYGLSAADASDVDRFLDSLTNPWAESPSHAHLPQNRPYRRISGTVVSIDLRGQRVTLDLPRYSRETGGPIILSLPRNCPAGRWVMASSSRALCQPIAEMSASC